MNPHRPETVSELMRRAQSMAGHTVQNLAKQIGKSVPKHLLQNKGWLGQLIEHYLGADSNSKPLPDFNHLKIELKTIPVDHTGKPTESTYICTAPLMDVAGLSWEDSVVYHKLAQVLWVPIQSDKSIPLSARKIGMPLLWQLSGENHDMIRADWEEHMEKIALGRIGEIRAENGNALQIRPKAANSKALRMAIGEEGQIIQTLPRGFYLRAKFTEKLLSDYYL